MSSPRSASSSSAPSYAPGHPSRRENQSVSSAASGSRSDRGARSRSSTPAVESAVTKLLVSIKALLEALTQWSNGLKDELEVSDVYVRLGNDFNTAVSAFGQYEIDMTELMTVPDDLRGVLEECLAEDANPKNLDKYLPTVRQIITSLLQGLRGKQSQYRRSVSESRHRSSASSSGHERDSKVSRASTSRRGDDASSPRARSRNLTEEGGSRRNTPSEDGASRRNTANSRSSRRKDSTQRQPPPGEDQFVGGFVAPDRTRSPAPPEQPMPQMPVPTRSDSYFSRAASPVDRARTPRTPVPGDAPPLQHAPAHVKRYSLVDKPPAVIVDRPADDGPNGEQVVSTPPPETPTMDGPAAASSLAALKKSDALERRASKRFSTYTFSKMTGGSVRSPGPNNRRSMAASNALTAGELAVLTEADEADEGSPAKESSRSRSRGPSPIDHAPPVPPLPKMPATPERGPAAGDMSFPNGIPDAESTPMPSRAGPASTSSSAFRAFMQVGREVKKVNIERDCSFSSLRMLFLDKFAYSPGKGDFPPIYVQDKSSGIKYELEDMDDVKEGCLLSLNIEPLDQIKEHIDTKIASLAQDIRDLRSSVATNRRMSVPPAPIVAQSFEPQSPPTQRPTDRQFARVARRLSKIMDNDREPGSVAPMVPQVTGQLQPQMTGASVMSESATRIVSDLRTQFDEVQNLRRDLGVMKQLYTDFVKTTKDSLGSLRTQTQNVRQLADSKVGGSRAYIESGKTSLDARSQNVLTRMEELQDLVESVKDDVLKKHIHPKPALLKTIKEDMAAVASELESLESQIKTVKPMWKKTWEEELQNIVEEQQFLHHQEEFLADLLDDQKAVVEVWGHVEKVISARGTTPGRGKKIGYRPPPPEENTGLTSVMMEIRGAAVDPQKRLKAIEASQKNRERDLASRSDEFQEELSGFVAGKKLKMTGGAEEAERLRQRRNEMALKAMFTGPAGASAPPSPMAEDGAGSPTPEAG